MAFGFDGLEDYVGSHLKLFISLTLGILVFVGMIALSVFFIAVKGKDEVMVPDVTGKELIPALLELQRKELYPRIQLRTSESSETKGLILEQEPEGGTIVKAERRISLVVSEGAALNKIGNYLGRTIGEVKNDIAALPLVSIKEPFMYQYAKDPAGTIIQQNPPAGTDLTGPVLLQLVVSRGQEDALITVPELEGLGLQAALERLRQAGLTFIFDLTDDPDGKPETVAVQNPPGGTEISTDTKVHLTLYAPIPEAGETAGLFSYTLPKNPYPLQISVDALLPGGGKRRLAALNHSGGEFSLPYRLSEGSTIILSILDREIYRTTVKQQEEP
jgi:beta-lactam-binding protein with PASTA domain